MDERMAPQPAATRPSFSEMGRMGGRPVRIDKAESSYGGTLSSVHAKRLQQLADKATGKDRDYLLAAIECIRTLTRKNRRMGAQLGASMKRRLLSHRGLQLSGRPEDIAQDIAEAAAGQRVHVYRMKRAIRVTTADRLPPAGEVKRIGTYDDGCDYRQVLEDVREAMAA